jgi:hypothetical protein
VIQKVANGQRALTKGSANFCGKLKPRSQIEGALFGWVKAGFHGVKGKLCPIKVIEIWLKL